MSEELKNLESLLFCYSEIWLAYLDKGLSLIEKDEDKLKFLDSARKERVKFCNDLNKSIFCK